MTRSRRKAATLVLVLIAAGLAVVAGCSRSGPVQPPPRANDRIAVEPASSRIAVPLDADIAQLDRALDQAIPRRLWTIDRQVDRCVAPQKIKLLGQRIAVTPKLGCRIEGEVTRSALRLRGEGQDILVDVPITATIGARNVGGVLGATATGSAMAHARIRLDIGSDWTPRAKVDLVYDWTTPPGIEILGQRIEFTGPADEKLRPIVAKLERDLPREVARLNLRAKVDRAWRSAFTVLELNDSNPPVWLRVTPQKLELGGYAIAGRKLQLRLGMTALTETFVGPRPADPAPTPLPALVRAEPGNALRFFLPVIADYRELEPVVQRALVKRQARPFVVPGLGNIMARFDKVTVYGTSGGRIAVGAHLVAMPEGASAATTSGTVWLTARPANAANSQTVAFTDLAITGQTDGRGGDLLLKLANAPAISQAIAAALTQHFEKDFAKLHGKVQRALVGKQAGDFLISARIDQVENGQIRAAGQGLYLPVRAMGQARVEFRPHGPLRL